MNKFTFFWRGPLSQWKRSLFTYKGINFNCAEQWMMYQKAILFNDLETANRILKVSNPKEQQNLGRRVKGFKQDIWDAHAREIVYRGNLLKYKQNPDLWKTLKNTAGTELAEASPYDCVWGIGYAEDHPNALNKDKWRGKNWLGECLTNVREDLMNDEIIGEIK